MKTSVKHHSLSFVVLLIGLIALSVSPRAEAISKILECQEVRSGPDQIEIEAFVNSQNTLYRMDVNSVSESAPNPTNLSAMVKDVTPAKSAAIRGQFKSKQFELTVSFEEGRTSEGDVGYKGIFKVLSPQAKAPIEMICWFAKRAAVEPAPVAPAATVQAPVPPKKPESPGKGEKPAAVADTKPAPKLASKPS